MLPFPDRPEDERGQQRQGAAGDGGAEALGRQGQGEGRAGLGQKDDKQGDEDHRQAVVALDEVAEEEAHRGGREHQGRKGQAQPKQPAGEDAADQGAEQALGGPLAGGAVVGLEDHDHGERQPVAVREVVGLEHPDPEDGQHRHPRRIQQQRALDPPAQVERGGQRPQGEGLEVEQLQRKGRPLVRPLDGRAQRRSDRRQVLLQLAQDRDQLGPRLGAVGLGGQARLEGAQEMVQALEPHVHGRQVGRLPGNDGEGHGAGGVGQGGQQGLERRRKRGEARLACQRLGRGVERDRAGGEAGGGLVQPLQPGDQGARARPPPPRPAPPGSGRASAAACASAARIASWRCGSAAPGGRRDRGEEIGGADPALRHRDPQRMLRADGPERHLEGDAPDPAEHRGHQVPGGLAGAARQGQGDEEEQAGGGGQRGAVLAAQVAPQARAGGHEDRGRQGEPERVGRSGPRGRRPPRGRRSSPAAGSGAGCSRRARRRARCSARRPPRRSSRPAGGPPTARQERHHEGEGAAPRAAEVGPQRLAFGQAAEAVLEASGASAPIRDKSRRRATFPPRRGRGSARWRARAAGRAKRIRAAPPSSGSNSSGTRGSR